MPPTWQVRVKDTTGAEVACFTGTKGGFRAFSFMRRVNTIGSYSLLIDKSADETLENFQARTVDLFVLDAQVEFWRRWPEAGIDWQLEFEGFHRTSSWYVNQDGQFVFQSSGRGYLDLLNRAIIEAYAGTSKSAKSGAAETVLKDFVREQLGADARVERQRPGLSIEEDGGRGVYITLQRSWKNVLQVCQEIAQAGLGDFDIVGTGAATFELRWYDRQRGTDRSDRIIFSYELGNMGSPQLSLARHNEVNAVLIGGQGEKEGRSIAWYEIANQIDDSPWNRCEMFRDARNEETEEGMGVVGQAILEEGKPRYALTFEPIQTPGCLFGKDYYFGDLVRATFLTYNGIQQVKQVTVTVNEDTAQDITIEMEEAKSTFETDIQDEIDVSESVVVNILPLSVSQSQSVYVSESRGVSIA